MNLTLRQLRAFAAVAETGSFTAAAATLHLTRSSPRSKKAMYEPSRSWKKMWT